MQTAHQSWAEIRATAQTASDHAYVISAMISAGPAGGPEEKAAAYRDQVAAAAYSHLDSLVLTASQLADLAVVVAGGRGGVNAHRLDALTRAHLARHNLILAHRSSRFPADDWRAVVWATVAGAAVLRAAEGRPVNLTPDEAVPLAVIERAMRSSKEQGMTSWPGNALTLRMAEMWKLVHYIRLPAPESEHWSGGIPPAVYRLTGAGVEALERHRSQDHTTVTVTARTADILQRVHRCTGEDLGRIDAKTANALQRCLDAGWVKEGRLVKNTERRTLKLTEAGREALEWWRFRQEAESTTTPEPSWPVTDIKAGEVVRLSNHKGFAGVGTGWVEVVEIRHVQKPTTRRLSHNYEVWVRDDNRPEPFLYAGRALYRTVRFHRK